MRKLILILLLLAMVSPALAVDRDTVYTVDIRTWVRNYLGGSSTSNKWTNSIIDGYTNLACRDYALFVGIPQKIRVVTTSGTADYALPSDFLRIRGVTLYNQGSLGRETALSYRALRSMDSKIKTLGNDDDQAHPLYYTIVGNDSIGTTDRSPMLKIDPPEAESDRDTLYVYYYAQAIELIADSTKTNVPYAGINLVVLSAFRSCLFMGRDDPTYMALIPLVDKMYQAEFDILTRDQSDLDYDPAAK